MDQCPRDGAATFQLEPTMVRSRQEHLERLSPPIPASAAESTDDRQLGAAAQPTVAIADSSWPAREGQSAQAKVASAVPLRDTERTTIVDSLIGQQVGEYVVNGLIGQGGMGVVYEAFQPMIGKRVAIKCLRRETAGDAEEEARLLTEARTANAIGHRGIIDIFGFGTLADGRRYFAMEYLTGQPLSERIDEGPMPLPEALALVQEILEPLGAAHTAGVIHRDLKPSNIFIVSQPDGSKYVKLLDFGLAKLGRGPTLQTNVRKIHGTPEFIAPEQALGEAVSARTDLYALGVIAFELITGQPPFVGSNFVEVVNKHLTASPPKVSSKRPGIPRRVDELVLRLMSKAPSDRPQSAEAVRAEIAAILQEYKSLGRPTEPSLPVVRSAAGAAAATPLVGVTPLAGTAPSDAKTVLSHAAVEDGEPTNLGTPLTDRPAPPRRSARTGESARRGEGGDAGRRAPDASEARRSTRSPARAPATPPTAALQAPGPPLRAPGAAPATTVGDAEEPAASGLEDAPGEARARRPPERRRSSAKHTAYPAPAVTPAPVPTAGTVRALLPVALKHVPPWIWYAVVVLIVAAGLGLGWLLSASGGKAPGVPKDLAPYDGGPARGPAPPGRPAKPPLPGRRG